MRIVDTPLRFARGRTVRELTLIGAGLALVYSAVHIGDRSWNVYAYALVTAAFALRFFAARVIYLSMCMAAVVLQLSCALLPSVTLAQVLPMVGEALALSVLLMGRDLVARFDAAEGGGLGLVRNYWRDLSPGHRRHLAWTSHAVAATSALVHHTWVNSTSWGVAPPAWMYAVVIGAGILGLLFFAGRALAAVGAVVLGVVVAAEMAPHVRAVLPLLSNHPTARAQPFVFVVSPHYTVVGFFLGVATALVALPWAIRWLRLAWR